MISDMQDLTEDFFDFIGVLSRSARKGVEIGADDVRQDLLEEFREMEALAAQRPGLQDQYHKVRLALVFFADYMIKESRLPFAREWSELAKDEGEHAGDEKFFDLLEDTLSDPSESATERLLVYYECLGMGFAGFYAGQDEYLRKLMKQISGRIRDHVDLSDDTLVCPDAYENVDTSDLVEPPAKRLIGTGLLVAGLCLVAFVTFVVMFVTSQSELDSALNALVETEGSLRSGGDS